MQDAEEYFPRGGKKPTFTHFKQNSNFLGKIEKGERKKRKPKGKIEGDDGYLSDENVKDIDLSIKNCATGISYKIVKSGLLILGRVHRIYETKLNMMLPCRMMGNVMACHISEPYNKLLEAYVNDQTDKVRELRSMFRPGQYVALKVLENDKNQLMLSMMPQHVNGGKTHSDLHKGTILQAAVSSVEDHGYVMDVGIPNTRAFLPKGDANPEVDMDTGVVTWCCVKSISPSAESCIVTLSGELTALAQAPPARSFSTTLLPATPLSFIVDKALENGIEGHVFKDTTAYVQRQHADKIRGKRPTLGQKVRAYILYVMPTRNTPFLTTKSIFETTYPDLEQEKKFNEGDIIDDAQVIKIIGRTVYLKLAKRSIGTIILKRIPVHEDLTDEEVIAKSYPIGSSHKVRVLCYYLCDYTYSVSDDPKVLEERYFSLQQLSVGQLVDATVKDVGDANVILAIGRVTGCVPHAHLLDAGVAPRAAQNRPALHKNKYQVGQRIKARVLSVDVESQRLFLTLKPSLLAPDLEVLHSYDQAEVGKAYTGTIKHVRNYVLVSFFNDVVAFVPRNFVTHEPLENLIDAFHVGQIVNCTIINLDAENKKMTGSLTTVPFWPEKKRKKRNNNFEDTEEVPVKKHKVNQNTFQNSEEETVNEHDSNKEELDAKNKKDKKRKNKGNFEEQEEPCKASKTDRKKSKIEDKNKEEIKKSEESDAIETDIYEDSDQILTPDDLGLIDLSDCVTAKKYKKKVVSLLKAVNARTRRLNTIDRKIMRIENNGLDATNKKFHTAMHTEKLVIEERIKKLLEVLKIAQEKLKEFGVEKPEYKKKGKDKKKKVKEEENNIEEKEKEEENKLEKRIKEIKVVESLEPALEIPSAKDFWSENVDSLPKNVQDKDSSSSDEEETEQPKKKRKKLTGAEKTARARAEEERIRQAEARAAAADSHPSSAESFERALLGRPDCSQLWIAYMAFHLQATEIEKARAVGRKALSTIAFREEDERLNVWLALVNLENRFGTKESQQKIIEEAVQMNEPYKVHSKLLDIYVETGKHQELSSLVELMMRKYKRQPEAYVACGAACFKLNLVDKARHVMQKAISVLENKEHVTVLVRFALLERSHGERERAEALLEQVLAVYPQRVDVAAVYVDMLVNAGDIDQVRQVMERLTSQKLPARKMKILYRKWVEVEEKHGNEQQVESIRQRAMEFLEKAKF